MSKIDLEKNDIDYILSPEAVRESTRRILKKCLKGETHFKFIESKMKPTVDFVLQTIEKNYPKLDIPFHSRWGHFNVGNIDRVKQFESLIDAVDSLERCRAKLDLVITSVLLDAGAGMQWRYKEDSTGEIYSRSEGLGVASYYMFTEGHFSSVESKYQADHKGLAKVSDKDLEQAFQVSEANPLVGIKGRVALLNNLGKTVEDNALYFPEGRPGSLIDYIKGHYGDRLEASALLRIVLQAFGPIWPSRLKAKGQNLGDVWIYPNGSQVNGVNELVAFHKLSQWLTYSLIGPIVEAGVQVDNVDHLTGLAEYRNGGLFIDTGVLEVRDQSMLNRQHTPDSDFIIEWRALTVQLLDHVGQEVQKALNKTSEDFPLAKVLEGGTWWAGRYIAKEKRPDGGPPIKLDSDGTVF